MNSNGEIVKIYNTLTKVLISEEQDNCSMRNKIKYMLFQIEKTEEIVARNMAMIEKYDGYKGIAKYKKF